jgi:hypothetical protein
MYLGYNTAVYATIKRRFSVANQFVAKRLIDWIPLDTVLRNRRDFIWTYFKKALDCSALQ